MPIAFFATMFVIFLLGMLAFGCSKLFCIAGMVLSLGLMVFMFLFSKKALAKKFYLSLTLATLIIFAISFGCKTTPVKNGLLYYEEQLEHITKLITGEKTEEAQKSIDLLVSGYGQSDNTIFLEALLLTQERKFSQAISRLNSCANKKSVEYYALAESIYIAESNPHKVNDLSNLYFNAAADFPEWTHAQKMAGMARLDQREYAMAEYLLLRAYEQDPMDFKTAYYLGVVSYELMRIDMALEFFNESVELGADEQTRNYIAWYVNEMLE